MSLSLQNKAMELFHEADKNGTETLDHDELIIVITGVLQQAGQGWGIPFPINKLTG